MAAESAEVLLIDDPETVAEMRTELSVRVDDLEFVEAADTVEALELLERRRIDCVVSNFEVPDENGVEFMGGLELLRSVRSRWDDLPFVLCTNIGNEDIARRAIAADVTDYVFRWGEEAAYDRLAGRVEAAVARRRAERRATHHRRISEVIRDINRALVRADTREAIEQSVCERLGDAEQYDLAWCGAVRTADGADARIDRKAWAGADAPPDETLPATAVDGAVARAARTRTAQIVRGAPAAPSGANEPLDVGAAAAIPFVFENDCYGVLMVHTDRSAAFDDTEREVLAELGETIAYAIDAVRARRAIEARERELEQQNEQLDEFVSIVSHDIRNPLAVAQLYLEEARRDCDHEALEEIDYSLDRMEGLVDDLLALARQGDQIESQTKLPLDEIVERAWATVDTGDARLERDGDLGTVRTDEGRLAQALENLFRNSVEHGSTDPRSASPREDAVEHGARPASGRSAPGDPVEHGSSGDRNGREAVEIRVGRLDGEREGFYVADDGPGIPPSKREEVLEMGYSTSDDGTGFGLGIVTQIVEAHGWSLSVAESEDGGARFEIVTGDAQ